MLASGRPVLQMRLGGPTWRPTRPPPRCAAATTCCTKASAPDSTVRFVVAVDLSASTALQALDGPMSAMPQVMKIGRLASVLAPVLSSGQDAAVIQVTREAAPPRRRDSDLVRACRPTSCRPRRRDGASYVGGADRDVHRRLRPARHRLPCFIGVVDRARVPPADGGVPLDLSCRSRRRHEPALDRRRVRRDRHDLPEAVGRQLCRCHESSRSSASSPCSCSRCCSGSRWTTRSSCSRGSVRSTARRATTPRRSSIGIATTARVITSAALIMISVFLAFVLDDDADRQDGRYRPRGRGPRRRDDRARGSRPGHDAAPRRRELVAPEVARARSCRTSTSRASTDLPPAEYEGGPAGEPQPSRTNRRRGAAATRDAGTAASGGIAAAP